MIDVGTNDVNAVERSIRAVTAIRQVVHAIWAVSRAQLPLVEQAASAAATYQRWVDETVERLAGPPQALEAAATLSVVFGPERPYSSALARRIIEAMPAGDLGIVGERLAEAVRQIPELDARVRFRSPGSVTHDDLHDVALAVARAVLQHGRDSAVVIVHVVDDDARLAVVPLLTAREPVDRPPETFSALGDVVATAITEATKGRLAVAAAETLRAELRARIAAADAARRACDDRRAELDRLLQSGRRETITRELLEIVAGREASWPTA
ncbi:MAG: F0F1 ATP synthase subunit gamma [Labilithrix sp.]|nr:F0F1 ATP synthase subunit gamma [Labilithrix sp.]MCW5812578.1 F0F1 ATP synthase subunit gamma [Labilithrix sp.]